jgi:hypothetical protein
MEEKYFRNLYGDIITDENGVSIIDILREGDLATIEYYAPRYDKRVTRLFEVEAISAGRTYIRLINGHMNFLISDGKFTDKELEPVFKSIIPVEKLTMVEHNFSKEQSITLKKKRN